MLNRTRKSILRRLATERAALAKACEDCEGTGQVVHLGDMLLQAVGRLEGDPEKVACSACHGTGRREPAFPALIDGVEYSSLSRVSERNGYRDGLKGSWVAVRPCDPECAGKTYLGLYLGDMVMSAFASVRGTVVQVQPFLNPAIWVFDLRRVVWGVGSWWGPITGPEGLRKITDQDIDNVWYVRALKELTEAQARGKGEGDGGEAGDASPEAPAPGEA